MQRTAPKPPWLRVRAPGGDAYHELKKTFRELDLFTVCEEARCPNVGECWREGTATVMLLGDVCTRGCRFCAVTTGRPGPVDVREPEHVALAIGKMALQYVVLTMVDRDDLPDGGAHHVARTVRGLRHLREDLLIETLVGDFQGNDEQLAVVAEAEPDVFAHNLEVVRRITRTVRDVRCSYDRSLQVLRAVKDRNPRQITKSSLMVGIGETDEEVRESLADLRSVGVDIVTIGQYLRPGEKFHEVLRYVHPEVFVGYQQEAERLGFRYAACGPLVRSSYKAAETFVRSILKPEDGDAADELLRERLRDAQLAAQRVQADHRGSPPHGSPVRLLPESMSELAARAAVDILRESASGSERLLSPSSLVRSKP